MINLTPRDRLQYALKVQRLHEVLVLKDDIHLQYKYKNINRATTQAASFQDKIIDAVIEDAVSGTSDPINSSNIKNGVENIIDSNLKNDAKRISYGIPEKAVNAAVSNISNRYQFILGNRIREEIPNLQGKIEDYINTKNLGNLSEAELTQKLKAEYGEHAQKRIQNIIKDSFHTNECNLSWVKAVYDGYSYKIWNNGRTKRTRVWHKAKFIHSVPIDETFDIYGSYPARMMYPGDLNGGAENVANCKCWLSYTNNKPSDLRGTGKKTTTKKSTKSTKSNKSKNNNGLINKIKNTVKKPVTPIKSKLDYLKNNNEDNYEPSKPKKGFINRLFSNFKNILKPKISVESTTIKYNQTKMTPVYIYEDIVISDGGGKLSPKFVRKIYSALPSSLKENISEIIILPEKRRENGYIGGSVKPGSTVIKLRDIPGASEYGHYVTLIHESAHVLDHAFFKKIYGVSNSIWEEAFLKDNIYNKYIDPKTGVVIIPDKFVSDYARKIAYKRYNAGEYDRFFAEDFAESIRLYFTNYDYLSRNFPNRCELIESILGAI